MPSHAKTTLAAAVHFAHAEAVVGRLWGGEGSALILGYHRVVEDYRAALRYAMPPMLISVATLEKHLDWLGRHCVFVTLDEAAAAYDSTRHYSGKPRVAITFDDGYRDFYECAFPLLQRKGIPAAVFVVTNLVGSPNLQTHDELYLLLNQIAVQGELSEHSLAQLLAAAGAAEQLMARLRPLLPNAFALTRTLLESLPHAQILRIVEKLGERAEVPAEVRQPLRALDWEALGQLQRAGITIGSHTQSHVFLVNECEYRIVEETAGSKEQAEQKLGAPIEHFAYPDGQFNEQVVDAVAAAGYRYAYTTCRHRDALRPQLTVPRRLLWEQSVLDQFGEFSPAVMSCQLHGVFDLRGGCRRVHAN
ncbi:MAG TPA: polysaccharide deacetylase family protein [Gammaproteobacteria bacterium]|nr:polysaccharide deacetylase family protein [Gammaproteobacteria bacterium]